MLSSLRHSNIGSVKGTEGLLGRWRAQGSDRYARVAARMITDLQSSTPTKKVRPKTRVRRQKQRGSSTTSCAASEQPRRTSQVLQEPRKKALSQRPEGCERPTLQERCQQRCIQLKRAGACGDGKTWSAPAQTNTEKGVWHDSGRC